ncbi:GNAT family N-acetyltransferase [Pedobacter gandavensis]|uniref:GNAT family N-acetyltransferase n=1 Tax=Pedobacter gandavensis TaxID=2679963 RepID=UPI00292CB315|nr:GNAT family N-acetyltransferase [Pedobacter gandavensis]
MTPILTSNLMLDALNLKDASFIMELVNTQGWKQFIGDRNVHDLPAAVAYVQKIMDNPAVTYYVVKLQQDHTPLGIVTLIKRDYLPQHDIGFAFLPVYTGKGYAYEAVCALLNDPEIRKAHPRLLASSLKDNVRSIRLLEKLGMVFEKEYVHDHENLLLFGMTLQ